MGIFARLRSAIQPPASLLYGVYTALSDPPVEGDIRPVALGPGGGLLIEGLGTPSTIGSTTPALSMSVTQAQSASLTWQVPVTTTRTSLLPAWAASTAYTDGRLVTHAGAYYRCITAGTTGATGPVGTVADETDGTAHWEFKGAVASFKGGAIARTVTGSASSPFFGDSTVKVTNGEEIPATQAEVDQSADLSAVYVVCASTATISVRAYL